MRPINKAFIVILTFISLQLFSALCRAEEFEPFQGRVNKNGINIRSDSTVSSEMVCQVSQGEYLEVVLELYDWYKVKLPKSAPSFMRKDLVALSDAEGIASSEKNGRVLKENVNIRLSPNDSSPILGKLGKDQIVKVQQEQGGWYKIEPPDVSFGWIHKNFVDQLTSEEMRVANQPESKISVETDSTALALAGEELKEEENPSFIGTIKPYRKFGQHTATHRLITEDNQTFLLKGERKEFDAFLRKKVKVIAKLTDSSAEKYPLLEIVKIELAD